MWRYVGWGCILNCIMPIMFPCFLLICYPYILLHFYVFLLLYSYTLIEDNIVSMLLRSTECTRAGTMYQYIDISQYWQSQYNINTSYYSIDISKYWYIAIYRLILEGINVKVYLKSTTCLFGTWRIPKSTTYIHVKCWLRPRASGSAETQARNY